MARPQHSVCPSIVHIVSHPFLCGIHAWILLGWYVNKDTAVHPHHRSVKPAFRAFQDYHFCKPNLPPCHLKWARTDLVIPLIPVTAGLPVVSAPPPTWATSPWLTHETTPEDQRLQLLVSTEYFMIGSALKTHYLILTMYIWYLLSSFDPTTVCGSSLSITSTEIPKATQFEVVRRTISSLLLTVNAFIEKK